MMDPIKLYLGKNELAHSEIKATGEYVKFDGEDYYQIKDYNHMKPFFMSIVSDTNHWMFLSSNGSLTAGRKNPENALFPYYTVDKIHDSSEITGGKTIIRITLEKKTFLWEPFSERYSGIYSIRRSIYKNTAGNKVIFEEINIDLGVIFRYSWNNSDKFGFIRKSEIENRSLHNITIDILDGIQNILPYGVNRNMQNDKSPLVDAYKKGELLIETGLGIYVLSSIPVDRAEPSEALRASTVWSIGDNIKSRLLSSLQLDHFRNGFEVSQEVDIRAQRGAYFNRIQQAISPFTTEKWYIIADVIQSSAKIANLNNLIKNNNNLIDQIVTDIKTGTTNLMKIVASADGIQLTNDKLTSHRQFSNVLFNVMRGGIFDKGYKISKSDFCLFVKQLNIKVYNRHAHFLKSLPNEIGHSELTELISQKDDAGLLRAGLEYLPLTFSRRHGDPSRPWNLFSIETRSENGDKILNYEGNWRDIFQNWEALCLSYPAYLESIISKFVNASTADGYNPYRITRNGFDWEIHDPSDPWSFIGYWGDHQIIYLLKFLELINKYFPGKLDHLFTAEIFSYANVPYRIKPYSEILANPHNSITYDETLAELISTRVNDCGSDGKMIWCKTGEVYYVNLTEKIILSALAKLANFIAEGGIWMNTQRPEWNDANNALVGSGVSMVTLYYLRRYISFCLDQFKNVTFSEVSLSDEVLTYLTNIKLAFEQNSSLLKGTISDKERKILLDKLGNAATQYRNAVYKSGFTEKKSSLKIKNLNEFFELTLKFIDHSINSNRRSDNLYHSYNILSINDGSIGLTHLSEMLEGQVAILCSGYLSSEESVILLDSLKKSKMFWNEEYSYLLYPDKHLPLFAAKNNLPEYVIEESPLLQNLLASNANSIIEKDILGNVHFHGTFTNKYVLGKALKKLDNALYNNLVAKESGKLMEIYEDLFNHKSFTGRSGTFFGYEGLGCIYWHMVSKLLLAVEEICIRSANANLDSKIINSLTNKYYDIRKGLGLNKTPDQYGAFPTDPYSHTPGHRGAQQPGMTGQVKEDIISRFGELGISVLNGEIHFSDLLLRKDEFLEEPANFSYIDIPGNLKEIPLVKGSLAFTFCQVPIIYKLAAESGITITTSSDKIKQTMSFINKDHSASIFQRNGNVKFIEVRFKL